MKFAISGVEFGESDLERMLETAKALEVEYIELWPKNIKGISKDSVKKSLTKRDINVACVNAPVSLEYQQEEQRNEIMQSLKLAKEFGAKYVSTFFGSNPNYSKLMSIEIYKNVIQPCLEFAEKEELVLLVENEFDEEGKELTRTAEGTMLVLSSVQSPYLKLNYDPCNFHIANEEAYPYAYEMLKDQIEYIHIKDATKFSELLHGSEEDHVIWEDISGKYICCPLGDGGVNYEGFFTKLKKDNYNGYLTLEPHVIQAQLQTTYRKSLSYMRSKINSE